MTDHALIRRRDAAQATLDVWASRPWRLGKSDCVRMTASHLRRLGYRVKLPPSGSYASVRSAMKALATMGHATIGEALDAIGLPRIAPAATLVGDLVLMPAEHELGALVVVLGGGRVVGWHESVPGGATVLQPLEMLAAWRVDPR